MRLCLSPFLNGVGFDKVAGISASLNINWVTGIDRTFYDNQETLTRAIIRITEEAIKEAQLAETKATIMEQLEKLGVDKQLQIEVCDDWLQNKKGYFTWQCWYLCIIWYGLAKAW